MISIAARWAGAVVLCAALSACGGGSGDAAPTALPSTVTISSATQAQVGSDAAFHTDIDNGLSGLSYRWTFGDGSTSNASQPTHRYAQPGTYQVSVTVTNQAGVTRTASFSVQAGYFNNIAGTLCAGGGSTGGWCWQQPKPTGQVLADFYFLDSNTAWAVGEGGAILKTIDGGITWAVQPSGTTSNLWLVRFVDANNGWAVGTGNLVLHTTDGGAHWQTQAVGYGNLSFNGGKLWALTAQRAVYAPNNYYSAAPYYTEDAGETWQVGVLTPTLATPNGTLFAQEYTGLKRSTDLGKTALQVFAEPAGGTIINVVFADNQRGLLTSYEPFVDGTNTDYRLVVWRTADGGTTWTRQVTDVPAYYYSNSLLKYDSSGVAWLYDYSSLYRSTDHGATWAIVAMPPSTYAYSASAFKILDADTVFLNFNTSMYVTRDAGATWSTVGTPDQQTYPSLLRAEGNDLWMAYSSFYYNAGSADRVYHSRDGGGTWTKVAGGDASDAGTSLTSVWFSSATKGLAVNTIGSIMSTADGGLTWTRKSPSPGSGFSGRRLQFRTASKGWMLSSGEGKIYKTTDGGDTWSAPLTTVLSGVADYHFVTDTRGWAVTYSGTVYQSTDGGMSWALQASSASGANAIQFVDAQHGVVVGQYGLVSTTSDGGATWRPRASGVGAALNRVTWVDSNTAWAVGDSGVVIKSTDQGTTWSIVPVPTTNALMDVTFVNASTGWIVGGNGTVLMTTDGGATWTVQPTNTSRTFYSAFFIDAQTGWLVGTGGAILATATGGK